MLNQFFNIPLTFHADAFLLHKKKGVGARAQEDPPSKEQAPEHPLLMERGASKKYQTSIGKSIYMIPLFALVWKTVRWREPPKRQNNSSVNAVSHTSFLIRLF